MWIVWWVLLEKDRCRNVKNDCNERNLVPFVKKLMYKYLLLNFYIQIKECCMFPLTFKFYLHGLGIFVWRRKLTIIVYCTKVVSEPWCPMKLIGTWRSLRYQFLKIFGFINVEREVFPVRSWVYAHRIAKLLFEI